jgi:hypothetical protein
VAKPSINYLRQSLVKKKITVKPLLKIAKAKNPDTHPIQIALEKYNQ